MTREEAIDIINSCVQADTEEVNEALDMAVKALEGCEDCISREGALKAFRELPHEYKTKEQRARTGGIAACEVIASELPSVTPKQRVGRWIDDTRLGYHVSICSNCNWRGHGDTCLIYKPKYCPNCGAKMAESEEQA